MKSIDLCLIDDWIKRNACTQTAEDILDYVNLKLKIAGDPNLMSMNRLRSRLTYLGVTPKRVRDDWTIPEDEVIIVSYFEKWEFPVLMALFDGKRSESSVRSRMNMRYSQIRELGFKSEEEAINQLKCPSIRSQSVASKDDIDTEVSNNTPAPEIAKKTRRVSWTEEFKYSFIREYNEYGTEFLIQKYGFSKSSISFYVSKYREYGANYKYSKYSEKSEKSSGVSTEVIRLPQENRIESNSIQLSLINADNCSNCIDKLCIFGNTEDEVLDVFKNFTTKSLLLVYEKDPSLKIGKLKIIREISELTSEGKNSIITYIDDSNRSHRMAYRIQ